MPSSYPGRHMPLPRLEPSTSEKRWVSVANWATPVGYRAVNEPNIQQTIHVLFSGKFVCVRSFIKQTNTNNNFHSFS
ncbi:hypothetical protein Hanom_Chr11g00976821 [Helianthus anomalus]